MRTCSMKTFFIKNALQLLGLLLLLSTSLAFSSKGDANFYGTYGVSTVDPSQIKLQILENHTFVFQDYSQAKHPVRVSGTWTLKGRKVVLTGKDNQNDFHRVWTFENNAQVAKSRKGLNFWRLCKIGD